MLILLNDIYSPAYTWVSAEASSRKLPTTTAVAARKRFSPLRSPMLNTKRIAYFVGIHHLPLSPFLSGKPSPFNWPGTRNPNGLKRSSEFSNPLSDKTRVLPSAIRPSYASS